MIRTAIYTILAADAGVSALTTNISHGIIAQETNMPFITFMVFDQDPHETKDTLSETDIVYISISCVSQNNLNVVAIGEAVRTALDGYAGTVDSTIIQSCSFQKFRDAWLPNAKAFQMTVEFQLFISL